MTRVPDTATPAAGASELDAPLGRALPAPRWSRTPAGPPDARPRADDRAVATGERAEPPPLDVWGLTRSWGKGADEVSVLDDLELTLEPGSLTWVGGANGVGKTTLLRVIAGLIRPTAGHVYVYGRHPERERRAYQQRLAFLSATSTGMYARLTVRRQVDYWARIAFIPRARRAAAVARALQDFSLDDLSDRRVDRLSMGQRQRVRLAMTFVKQPDLVLLDEPRNSLDTQGAAMLVAAISEVRARGGAVLWCSPLGEPLGLPFDRRLVLEHGRLRPS